MNIVPDTNVLLRASIGDDPKQSLLAIAMLQQAEIVALTIPTLCEFVWVLAVSTSVISPISPARCANSSTVTPCKLTAQRLRPASPCLRLEGISRMALLRSTVGVWAGQCSSVSIGRPLVWSNAMAERRYSSMMAFSHSVIPTFDQISFQRLKHLIHRQIREIIAPQDRHARLTRRT